MLSVYPQYFRLIAQLLFISLLIATSNVNAFDYYQVLPKTPLTSKQNPQTAEKIKLGKTLFFDSRLSSTTSLSCNSCHNLLTGGDDDQAKSTGASGKETTRSAPALWNIGLQTVLYWDGRIDTLEQQAIDHLLDANIMGNNSEAMLVKRIKNDKDYKVAFAKAFTSNQTINLNNISKALAVFQRELMAHNSPFDRYMRGDKHAISILAKKGKEEFLNAGCLACHFGYNFAGPAPGPALSEMGDGFYELFPNNRGSIYDQQFHLTADLGRYTATGLEDEKYMWRVPPLRNIALSAPYFHNGSVKTLRMAIKVMGKTQFNHELNEDQIDAIAAFLNSLTGEMPEILRRH